MLEVGKAVLYRYGNENNANVCFFKKKKTTKTQQTYKLLLYTCV